jgi:hypothetical protein
LEPISHRSTPSPELARAFLQLLNEGYSWTAACRQLRVHVSRATHWRTEQPWFGQLCRLVAMAAFVEAIERLNPDAVSKTRPGALEAAAQVRSALHARVPYALNQLLEDPPFNVRPEDDLLVREGIWRMEREVRRHRERIARGEIPPDDPERAERSYQALKIVFAAADNEEVDEAQLKDALAVLRGAA